MNMRFIRLLVIFSIWLFAYRISFAGDDTVCQAKSIDTFEVNIETGNLLFTIGGEIQSIDKSLLADQKMLFNGKVSPNGLYLANSTRDHNVNIVRVFNTVGELKYSGAPSEANILGVHWLNNDRVLSFVLMNAGQGGGDIEFGVGYFIIDPFNQQYTYHEPLRDSTFYTQIPDRAFIEGPYRITYDGHYLFNMNRPIYDFKTDQELILENYRWGIPSATSPRLIVADREVYLNEGFYPVYIYDFDTDILLQVSTFVPDSEIVDRYENSWSPNESLWFYALEYSNEDLESFRRIEVLELGSGDIRPTCFGLLLYLGGDDDLQYVRGLSSPDFAWSRDGRYLALMAVVEGQDMEESFGLYLYDTQTEDIYLVHQGNADIIGWLAQSEEKIAD